MKLSIVIPARNEVDHDRRDGHRPHRGARARGDRLRAARRRRLERRRDARPGRRLSRAQNPRIRWLASHLPRGFGFAVRAGLERFEGDAVAIVMADGSDARKTSSRTTACSRTGYDCVFGSRFVRGARVIRLSATEARPEPDGEPRHPRAVPARLQRHDERLQGIPARGDRDGSAAALESLQPHRRAAAEGDRPRPQLRGRPDLVDEPDGGRVEAVGCRRWAAATSSSSSTSSSSTTSAAATTGFPVQPNRRRFQAGRTSHRGAGAD